MEKYIGKNILCFDVETTGLPTENKKNNNWLTKERYFSPTENDKYDSSRIVQIAWSYIEKFSLEKLENYNIVSFIRKPVEFDIDDKSDSTKIHKITSNIAKTKGLLLSDILNNNGLRESILKCNQILGHNILFDIHILMNEFYRMKYVHVYNKLQNILDDNKFICTLMLGKKLVKKQKLSELYKHFYNKVPKDLHNAHTDVNLTLQIFKKMLVYEKDSHVQTSISSYLNNSESTKTLTKNIEMCQICQDDKFDNVQGSIYECNKNGHAICINCMCTEESGDIYMQEGDYYHYCSRAYNNNINRKWDKKSGNIYEEWYEKSSNIYKDNEEYNDDNNNIHITDDELDNNSDCDACEHDLDNYEIKKSNVKNEAVVIMKGCIGFFFGGALKVGSALVFVSKYDDIQSVYDKARTYLGRYTICKYVVCENASDVFDKLKEEIREFYDFDNVYLIHASTLFDKLKDVSGVNRCKTLKEMNEHDEEEDNEEEDNEEEDNEEEDNEEDNEEEDNEEDNEEEDNIEKLIDNKNMFAIVYFISDDYKCPVVLFSSNDKLEINKFMKTIYNKYEKHSEEIWTIKYKSKCEHYCIPIKLINNKIIDNLENYDKKIKLPSFGFNNVSFWIYNIEKISITEIQKISNDNQSDFEWEMQKEDELKPTLLFM
jgi:hypothetical protein